MAELTDQQKAERQAALNKAYGNASQQLRDNHRDEFNSLYTAAAAALGQTWHPRQTAEQRAADEFDRLIREFPFLADRLPLDTAPVDQQASEAG